MNEKSWQQKFDGSVTIQTMTHYSQHAALHLALSGRKIDTRLAKKEMTVETSLQISVRLVAERLRL